MDSGKQILQLTPGDRRFLRTVPVSKSKLRRIGGSSVPENPVTCRRSSTTAAPATAVTIARLCEVDEHLLLATPFQVVDVNDTTSCDAATAWWTDMTAAGREGMVVKPLEFISKGRRGFAQPAIKCRGPEYLRIIYGPEYLLPENLDRLRSRAVGSKRSLASREFALGIEALERFVRKEPLRRTHECVFGVLALESEPIDPRL